MALAYSALHFLKTGVIFALQNFYGDFLPNFPIHAIADRFNPAFRHAFADIINPPPMWNYGPVMHLVTFPLVFLPSLHEAYRIWLFINYGFLVVAFWYLFRLAFPGPMSLSSLTIFLVVVLNYYPLYEAIIQRTIEIFELLLVVVAMTLYSRQRDAMAGSAVGFAAMTKFLPGIFVPYFVLKGRWRAVWPAVTVIVILGIVAQMALGWEHNWVVKHFREGTGYAPAGQDLTHQLNQSVSGPVLRLAHWMGRGEYGIPVSRALIIGLAVALGWVMLHFRSRGNWMVEWSLLIVAMVMLLPHNQNYYLLFLLIPYAVLLGTVGDGLLQGWRWKALIWVSFVLTGWPMPLSLLDQALKRPSGPLLLDLSIPVFGAALLVVVLIKALWRSCETTVSVA